MCDLRILRPLVMTAGYDCYEPWSLSRVELCTTKHSKGNLSFWQCKICSNYNYNFRFLNVMDVTTLAKQGTV